MNKEYILCAANYYDDGKEHPHQPKNIKTGYVICGRRHHNIFVIPYILYGGNVDKCPEDTEQGFITNLDRFVDRIEGKDIAIAAEQVDADKVGRRLYSEDLY